MPVPGVRNGGNGLFCCKGIAAVAAWLDENISGVG